MDNSAALQQMECITQQTQQGTIMQVHLPTAAVATGHSLSSNSCVVGQYCEVRFPISYTHVCNCAERIGVLYIVSQTEKSAIEHLTYILIACVQTTYQVLGFGPIYCWQLMKQV